MQDFQKFLIYILILKFEISHFNKISSSNNYYRSIYQRFNKLNYLKSKANLNEVVQLILH